MARSAIQSPQSVSTSRHSRLSTAAPTPARSIHGARAPSTIARSSLSHSRGTPGPSGTSAVSGAGLPPYQATSAPLNDASLDALSRILDSNNGIFHTLTKSLETAKNYIEESAGEINDCLREHTENIANARVEREKRRRKEGDGDNEERMDDAEQMERDEKEDVKLMEFHGRVQNMTGRLEGQVRKVIDGYAGLNALQSSIKDTQKKAVDASVAAVGDLATQTQTQRTTQGSLDTDESAVPSLAPALTENLTRRTDKYTNQTLTARYSTHNDYVSFKRVVHDSHYPTAGPPLPHASTWFQREEGRGSPAPGITGGTNTTNAEDSDDDIAISRENISTRCPLTLRDFAEPVTSTKCPHSYERSAIFELIHQQPRVAPPGPRGAPAPDAASYVQKVRCPVPGCEHMLGEADLTHDPVLVRRIKRMLAAKEREREELEAEQEEGGRAGGRRRVVEEIESGSEGEGMDIDELDRRGGGGLKRGMTPAAKVKAEMMRSSGRGRDEIVDD